jgi:dephospho-CoA kinase
MKVVGLTGGIGCGKSTVARLLVERGARLIDADALARVVVEPGRPAHADIVAEYGNAVLNPDRTLNREALAAIVFNDPSRRDRLNRITHPRIGEEMLRLIKSCQDAGAAVAIIDAALLLESPATRWIKPVIVVVCDPAIRIPRIAERDRASIAEIQARIDSQWSDAERAAKADYVIDNSGDPGSLERQVDEVWGRLTQG